MRTSTFIYVLKDPDTGKVRYVGKTNNHQFCFGMKDNPPGNPWSVFFDEDGGFHRDPPFHRTVKKRFTVKPIRVTV